MHASSSLPALPACVPRRFVKFGGGVSAEQLAWLGRELAAAEAAGERVVACCHLCFHPDACAPACLLWNYDQVLQASGGRRAVGVGCWELTPFAMLLSLLVC